MDINQFSENLQSIVMKALQQATTSRHTEITTVHMLYQIFSDSTIDGLLNRIGVDKSESLKICADHMKNIGVVDYVPQPIFNRKVTESFSNALVWANEHDEKYLTVATVFIELLFNKSSVSNEIVKKYNLKRNEVTSQELERRGGKKMTEATSENNLEALEKYGHDLVQDVINGKIDPVIGRDEERRRVIEILPRKTKNNPVLIGEPGVGKTAVVEGVPSLMGAPVKACDLRAGAAMVIAGLAAKGVTTVDDICYIERGYEEIVEKLQALGADIERIYVAPSTAQAI